MSALRQFCEAVARGTDDVAKLSQAPSEKPVGWPGWVSGHFCFVNFTESPPLGPKISAFRPAHMAPPSELDNLVYIVTKHHPADLPLNTCTKVHLAEHNPFFRNGGSIAKSLAHLRANTVGILVFGYREIGRLECNTLFCEHEADAIIASEMIRDKDWLK